MWWILAGFSSDLMRLDPIKNLFMVSDKPHQKDDFREVPLKGMDGNVRIRKLNWTSLPSLPLS